MPGARTAIPPYPLKSFSRRKDSIKIADITSKPAKTRPQEI